MIIEWVEDRLGYEDLLVNSIRPSGHWVRLHADQNGKHLANAGYTGGGLFDSIDEGKAWVEAQYMMGVY